MPKNLYAKNVISLVVKKVIMINIYLLESIKSLQIVTKKCQKMPKQKGMNVYVVNLISTGKVCQITKKYVILQLMKRMKKI